MNNKIETNIFQMRVLRAYTVLTLFLFMGFGALSQQNTGSHNEQVTIVGSYDPSINEAYKINLKPEAMEIELQQQNFEYDFLEIRQNTIVGSNPIKPINLRSGRRTKKFDNFLMAGFGSRISPFIDFYHSSGKKGSYNFNANLYHYSSFNNIQDYSPSPFSETSAKVKYSKFFGEHVIDLGLKYGLKTNKYYGFKPDDWAAIDIPDQDLNQMFNLVKVRAVVRSAYKSQSKLHHTVGLETYYYFDKHNTSELNAKVDFDLYKGFDVLDVLDYQSIGLKGKFDFYSNNDSLNNLSEFFVEAQPYFKAKYGQFSFVAGLKFGYLGDTAGSFHFWPVIDVNMNIIPGGFSIFAGVNGKMEKQSYLNLTTENPYLSSVATLGWLNEKINVYGGFRASLAQLVGLNFKIGWKTFDNMAFFINKAEYLTPSLTPQGPLNKFETIFDNGSVFYTQADVSFNMGKDLKLLLGGEFNSYKLDSLEQAYHKPLTVVRFGFSYLIAGKVKVGSELSFNGKRYALDPTGLAPTLVELDSYIDLNASVEYKINEDFSAFLNGTNLLNKNYDRFYSYPVQGFQIMAGVSYRF